MKILLFGKNGQVGWELQRSLSVLGEVIALDRHSKSFCGNLENLERIKDTIQTIKPDIIVNAAAYTAVDQAESNFDLANLINYEAVKVIAKEAEKINAWFLHYSTDYVFDGNSNKPWTESDKTNPINIYGKTKLFGEEAIQEYCSKYLILRTSWVYSSKGNNFIKTILRLINEKKELSIIDDQNGSPTSAELIADCTAHCIKTIQDDKLQNMFYHLV